MPPSFGIMTIRVKSGSRDFSNLSARLENIMSAIKSIPESGVLGDKSEVHRVGPMNKKDTVVESASIKSIPLSGVAGDVPRAPSV